MDSRILAPHQSLVVVLACVGAVAGAANASLVLSTHSSGEGQIPASALDATLDFQVAGNIFTLTFTNDTNGTGLLDISALAFNVSDDIIGLSLTSATHSVEGDVTTHWPLFVSDFTPGDFNSTTQFDGFGVFDWALILDRDVSPKEVMLRPGQNIAFSFAISGVGPFDTSDFGMELSFDPGDIDPAILSLVAAKFRGRDDGDFMNLSAFGATVPTPSALALLALGGVMGARRRRR